MHSLLVAEPSAPQVPRSPPGITLSLDLGNGFWGTHSSEMNPPSLGHKCHQDTVLVLKELGRHGPKEL